MAVEAKRGCGYRKVGGTYLVGGGIGVPCDRLPFELGICPCCNAGFKPSLGWTWIRPGLLFQGKHYLKIGDYPDPKFQAELCLEAEDHSCWLCADPGKFEKAGLIWIGGGFYKSPADFLKEGVAMGFSRRINSIPRGFKIGETPVLLAHRKTIERAVTPEDIELNPKLKGELLASFPGIFYVWIPQFIEKIFKESDRDSEAVKDAEKRGIRPVFVPDNDRDHQGTVYDKEEEQ
jgi:hypothetical protein